MAMTARARPGGRQVRLVVDERELIRRAFHLLFKAGTTSGHLAQRVNHEPLGYCAHNRESAECIAYRDLMNDLAEYLESPEPRAAGAAAAAAGGRAE
jgi:hypothetical protein